MGSESKSAGITPVITTVYQGATSLVDGSNQAGGGTTYVYGSAEPGQPLVISDGTTVRARVGADPKGRWHADFDGPEPGGTYKLTAEGDLNELVSEPYTIIRVAPPK